MALSAARGSAAPKSGMTVRAGFGLAFVFLFFVISGAIAFQNITMLSDIPNSSDSPHHSVEGRDMLQSKQPGPPSSESSQSTRNLELFWPFSWALFWYQLMRIVDPLPKGAQRVTYTCVGSPLRIS